MSSICHGFVQNAWRKDICSNCFRLRDEHSSKENPADLNRFSSSLSSSSSSSSLPLHQQQNGVNNNNNSSGLSDNNSPHHQHDPKMSNHSISILVKNSDMNAKSGTGRYQSPTSGIPRANSHLKYSSSNSKSYYSTFNADSFSKAGKFNGHLNGSSSGNATPSSNPEVIAKSYSSASNNNGVSNASKKVVTHPFKGDKDSSHHVTSNRLVGSLLNGSSPAPSSTLVSLHGNGVVSASSGSKASSSNNLSHYNNNQLSANANNTTNINNHNNNTNDTNTNKRSSGSVVSGAGGASSSSSASSALNGTVVSIVTTNSPKPELLSPPSKNNQSPNKSDTNGLTNGESKKYIKNTSEGVRFAKFDSNMDKSSRDLPDGDGILAKTKKLSKGILKSLDMKKRRKLSVKFPKEVCEVIGYASGDEEEEEEEEEEDVDDPQDLSSISELLANNSTTSEEKDLHQLTIKNTNFNSIKTNLLGYAPIEIGPIVGCMGGKSMENSSKPLVSIGTFESRKEPLRIKKINDMDVEVKNDDIKEKEILTVAAAAKVTKDKPKLNGILKNNNNNPSSAEAKSPPEPSKLQQSPQQLQQQRVNINDDNLVVNVSVNTANVKVAPGNKNYQPTTTTTPTPAATNASGSSKSNDVKINGKEIVSRHDGVSTIEVNPEKSSIKITTDEPLKSASGSSSSPSAIHSTINSAEKLTPSSATLKKSNNQPPPDNDNGLAINSTNSESQSSNNNNSNSSSSNSSSANKTENPLNNLIILNGGNIASKRTSFLKEIIEPVTVVSSQTSPLLLSNNTHNHGSVEEPMSLCLEKDSLDATVLNNTTSLKANLNHLKLSHLRAYEIEDNNSEFDDSLEDSGLDIGKSKATVENSSESDDNDIEKFGSSSDSGNENDFNDRMDVPKNGLYISVDDVDGKSSDSASKPKLSPDSVLFSSASEMSNSGSAESIPECVNVHVVAAAVKRQAPLPPVVAPPPAPIAPSSCLPESMYTNHEEDEDQVEDIYDDVSSYQLDRQLQLQQLQQQQQQEVEEEQEEESIYDDCNAISSSNGKSVTGSYDFTNGARTMLDTDCGADSVERIPLRPSDGIEFIGIRKIDSETHLNAALANERQPRSPSPEGSKKERSSSVSPKARRKVNQFFSTLGKKAGAAFSSSHSPLSGTVGFMRNKSPSPAPIATVTEYKRSLSQDEVSMARTQEIYATLTPASLKFKGLAPVLQKLSRMDTSGGSSSNSPVEGKEDSPKEKMFKKHKILPSIKKMFRVGGKDRDSDNARSYDFKTELKSSPSHGSDCSTSNAASSESSSNPPSLDDTNNERNRVLPTASKPSSRPGPPATRPPPPPPRVHSLDLLNRVGTVGPNTNMGSHNHSHSHNTIGPNSTIGSGKPARPPPPVRSNRIAPSFVSVFATQDEGLFSNDAGPPSKPKRKASMNGHSNASHLRNDGEPSLDNNVTSLNFETLRLIAGQTPAKIKTKSSYLAKCSSTPIRWSHFYLSDFEPMADGDYFAFYSALWENEPCVLLIEEAASNAAFVNLACVDVAASFVDNIPIDLIPWNPTDYHTGCHDVRVNVSVLPSCTVKKIPSYISSRSFSSMQKYFALLQALDYWGKEDMSDLLVFQGGCKDQATPADSELVYVVPVNSPKSLHRSYSQLSNNFEITLKQYLLQPHVLSGEDRQVLYRLISGTAQEVENQIKLFLQVKLFGSRLKSEEMEKLKRTKSERVIHQWIERERALCMKEAIERTIQRDNEPISPLKKLFVEFLMIPDIRAKALLDLVVDLCN